MRKEYISKWLEDLDEAQPPEDHPLLIHPPIHPPLAPPPPQQYSAVPRRKPVPCKDTDLDLQYWNKQNTAPQNTRAPPPKPVSSESADLDLQYWNKQNTAPQNTRASPQNSVRKPVSGESVDLDLQHWMKHNANYRYSTIYTRTPVPGNKDADLYLQHRNKQDSMLAPLENPTTAKPKILPGNNTTRAIHDLPKLTVPKTNPTTRPDPHAGNTSIAETPAAYKFPQQALPSNNNNNKNSNEPTFRQRMRHLGHIDTAPIPDDPVAVDCTGAKLTAGHGHYCDDLLAQAQKDELEYQKLRKAFAAGEKELARRMSAAAAAAADQDLHRSNAAPPPLAAQKPGKAHVAAKRRDGALKPAQQNRDLTGQSQLTARGVKRERSRHVRFG